MVVQGRYDIVCPMQTAWDLHLGWPEAEFKVIDAAGHSASELDTEKELVAAAEKFKGL